MWLIIVLGAAVVIGLVIGIVTVVGQSKGDNQLAQSGFTITRSIFSLRIDDKNRKWCINNGFGEKKIYDFSEVVDCKIEENSVLNKVNKLGVYIYTLNYGALYIDLINTATKRDSAMYNSNMNFAQQIYAAVQSMKVQPAASPIVPVPTNTVVTNNSVNDIEEQLTKLKSMVDSGIITQEDYEAKKKQLLGL